MCQALYTSSPRVYPVCWADSEAFRLRDSHAHSGPTRCSGDSFWSSGTTRGHPVHSLPPSLYALKKQAKI